MTTASDTPLVVVTGGAGFIGSHTVDLLVERGCQVVVLDDFSTGKPANLAAWRDDDRVEVLQVDISDGIFAALAPVTARRGPVSRIVHLAAQTAVTHSIANPLVDVRINYIGTVQVLEYARAMGVRHVVFASSAAVYGDVTEFPVRTTLPTRPLSPYGIDKRASEMMLSYYAEIHGLASTALRFFNVYGPRQDPSSPYSGVISIFADRAMNDRPITIFGDGEQSRDFIYVGDICRAIVKAVLSERGGHAVCNLGTGAEITVNGLAALLVELCESSSTISHAEARAGEILRSVAAVDGASEIFGAEHRIAEVELRDGLARTLDWVRAQH